MSEVSGVEKFVTSVNNDKDARKLEVEFDFGGSTARAVELFGEEAVYAAFVKGSKVALQGNVRAKLSLEGEDELTDDEILAGVAEWKPGTRVARGASKTSKVEKIVDSMSEDERLALIAKLQEMAA